MIAGVLLVEEDMIGARYFNYGRLGTMYAREAGSGNSNNSWWVQEPVFFTLILVRAHKPLLTRQPYRIQSSPRSLLRDCLWRRCCAVI
ncbi:uncharacterized protein BJ212DRAFT_1328692 [Suillus subaureus]|uniref:Uncharacterized protein n=1 Tax=Suillus subaureus TaxID=48587 RepID=A0A9P7EJ16_9AGAM|nr:uncharacterized protein BJ212DRAFT_1328692 [Suillus subaureus]KAG1822536.1 hypothetical protein BJ212DRAFT_1328692 [Suillus subaureus]